MKQFLSLLLAFVLILSAQMGVLTARAEQTPAEPTEELPLTQTLPSGVREDGTLDGDIVKQWVDAYLTENHWDSPGCQMAIAYWYSGTMSPGIITPTSGSAGSTGTSSRCACITRRS